MNYKIINGSVSYGAETILEEIYMEIKEKDKIGIVGRNGSGKTTLLKSIIDNSLLEEGTGEDKFNVYKQGTPNIGYLKQIDFEDSSSTLLDEILKIYTPLKLLEIRLEDLSKKLQNSKDESLISEYTNSMEKYEFLGGYTYKKEYETALKKFGFIEEDKNKKISEFSGGQRTKIAFLKLLLSKPDILLLDEPTNHLDVSAIEWLEGYLKTYSKAVVIVSHDRMFLNRIVNKIYEIEYGQLKEYSGNYEAYEKQKRENYEKQIKDYEYQQAEIKRLQTIADKFRYKPTKAKMALSKLKKIEQMNIIEEPNRYDLKTFHTNFNIEVESGKKVLEVKDLEIGYNIPIAKISFDLYKGKKLAIIGENGIGKSTLLKTLNGNIEKISGKFEFGYNVIKEYFDQQMEFENPDITVFDEFYSKFPYLTTTQIRTILGTFLFSGEDVFKKINVLSGGEKARLQLCKIFKKSPNLMLLDEPTNHMDIVGKESLENILKEYKGTLIFVSHDRYFINKIADCILELKKNSATFFDGNYSEYMEYKEKIKEENIQINDTKKEKNKNNEYFRNKEKNKINSKISKIEKDIEEKENEIKVLEQKMQEKEISTDYLKLNELQKKIQALNNDIELKIQEWEEMNEKLTKL